MKGTFCTYLVLRRIRTVGLKKSAILVYALPLSNRFHGVDSNHRIYTLNLSHIGITLYRCNHLKESMEYPVSHTGTAGQRLYDLNTHANKFFLYNILHLQVIIFLLPAPPQWTGNNTFSYSAGYLFHYPLTTPTVFNLRIGVTISVCCSITSSMSL